MNINAARAKTAFAIGQVKPPETDKALVKPLGQASIFNGAIKRLVPQFQRIGVLAAKVMLTLPFKSAFLRKLAKFAGLDQKSAGEDIILNEIDGSGVGYEQVIGDANILDRRAASGFQTARDAVHERAPIFAAQRLYHLHTGDGVKSAGDITVILMPVFDLWRSMRLGPCELLIGKADCGDLCTLTRKMFRQRAPTAPNFQHRFRFAQPLGYPFKLTFLRRRQVAIG